MRSHRQGTEEGMATQDRSSGARRCTCSKRNTQRTSFSAKIWPTGDGRGRTSEKAEEDDTAVHEMLVMNTGERAGGEQPER